jgi:hypothetical protein
MRPARGSSDADSELEDEGLEMSLLIEIARCPNVPVCMEGGHEGHPCSTIVRSQSAHGLNDFQVPEPWSGHIESAAVLFVSSNPSISDVDAYPRWSETDGLIAAYFTHRFGGGRKLWIKDGRYGLQGDGAYGRAVPFWSAVRQRAIELLERPVRPGRDYALTEVVHCKSRAERGVREALGECAGRYLGPVLELAGARVIVALGRPAQSALLQTYGLPDSPNLFGPISIGHKERLIAFLPHPNARRARTFSKCFSAEQLHRLRSFLERTG